MLKRFIHVPFIDTSCYDCGSYSGPIVFSPILLIAGNTVSVASLLIGVVLVLGKRVSGRSLGVGSNDRNDRIYDPGFHSTMA